MHNIGGLIWVILVLVGIVSSLSKNVKRVSASKRPVAAPLPRPVRGALVRMPGPEPAVVAAPSSSATPEPRTQQSPLVVPTGGTLIAGDAVTAPEPPQLNLSLRDLVLPPSFHLDALEEPRRKNVVTGLFQGKDTFVRAIIAAEVLGKPKALQEQSIWSPRHSEPSI